MTEPLAAGLTALDRECLEFQTGFLSGLVQVSWGEPEQLHLYARRYADVLALLGRTREQEYYSLIANTAASELGRAAQKAWDARPLLLRLAAGREGRAQWTGAYTESLLIEAEDRLRTLRDQTADYRAHMAHHFDGTGSDPVPAARTHTNRN